MAAFSQQSGWFDGNEHKEQNQNFKWISRDYFKLLELRPRTDLKRYYLQPLILGNINWLR